MTTNQQIDESTRPAGLKGARVVRGAISALGPVARLVLGAVFVWAGASKLVDLRAFGESVGAYHLSPESLIPAAAAGFAWAETLCGAALILGLVARPAAWMIAALLVIFTAAEVSAWARGIDISCGCFGTGGAKVGWWSLGRNLGLLALAAWVGARRESAFSLDHLLPSRWNPRWRPVGLIAVTVIGWGVVWAGHMGAQPAAAPVPEGLSVKARQRDAAHVTIDLFVMSNCPFGVAAEDVIFRRLEPLGFPLDVRLHFIAEDREASPELMNNAVIAAHRSETGCHSARFQGTGRFASLHGPQEVEEDIRQAAVEAHWPDRLGAYVLARNSSRLAHGWREDAASVGIDPEALQALIASGEAERLFVENLSEARRLGIRGSPTIFINGEMLTEPVSQTSVFRAVAEAFGNGDERERLLAALPSGQFVVHRTGGLTCVQSEKEDVWLCCPSADESGRDEMALVPDPSHQGRYLCVDRYEASVAGHERPLDGAQAVSDEIVADTPRAISVRGVVPQPFISGNTSRTLCESAGKRLCTYDEWHLACAGEDGEPFPYGTEYVPGACYDSGEPPPLQVYDFAEMNAPGLATGRTMPTGSHPDCVRRFDVLGRSGLSAVYDMIGNLSEWTAGRMTDNFYGMSYERYHVTCDTTAGHAPRWSDYSTGFRCCADAVVLADLPPESE